MTKGQRSKQTSKDSTNTKGWSHVFRKYCQSWKRENSV